MKRVIMIMAIATSVSFATQAINPVEKNNQSAGSSNSG
jgi:hypothetical protein